MKEKYIDFLGKDSSGNVFVEAIKFSAGLEKTASIKTSELQPQLRDFIDRLKPVPGKLFVLVNALGAGEFWSANLNADWFSDAVLSNKDDANGYKTFLKAGVFRNHVNKDMAKSFGIVRIAVYNPKMHRVELLIEIDREKARLEGHQDLVDELDAGKNPCVSMGMRTPFDICSICDHQSRTQSDRCSHIISQKNVTLPDGRLVCMINPVFKAFDISFVTIGADNTSFAIAKVASVLSKLPQKSQIKTATAPALPVKTASNKLAELLKHVPAMSALQSRERSIPTPLLDQLGEAPLSQSLATTGAAGIALQPKEFQRIILIQLGNRGLANDLGRENACFSPSRSDAKCGCCSGSGCACCDEDDQEGGHEAAEAGPMCNYSEQDVSPSLLRALLPMLASRSGYAPMLAPRLSSLSLSPMEKVSFVSRGHIPTLDAVADLYNSYRTGLLTKTARFARFASQNAEILSTMAPDELEMSLAGLAKTAGMPEKITMLGVLPMTYFLTQMFKDSGEKGVVNFVKDHPVITGSFLVGMLGMLAKR